ncbi:MAG: hypothetical protein H7343_16365 [Undibacterium sp.]|nr:hypothetical protein [Opitutaceae bacterium]
MRARGLIAEAERLHSHEFAAALAAAESEMEEILPGHASEEVRTLLDAEETRVNEALLLAEILVPLIAEKINLARPSTEQVSVRAPAPHPRASARPAAVPRHRDDPAPSIADLIDGMLGQENSAH